jgi:hypothetical protein
MRLRKALYSFGFGLTLAASQAAAADPQPAPLPSGSWPAAHGQPGCPSPLAPVPAAPGTAAPGTAVPAPPAAGQPEALPPDAGALAGAEERGTGAAGSAVPNMFGDLLARFTPDPLTVMLNGQTIRLTRGQPIPPNLFVPGSSKFNFDIVGPNGQVFALANTIVPVGTPYPAGPLPGFQAQGGRIQALVAQGAFKITENESPRPQDRVFATYNYFNNVGSGLNPPGLPQSDVHREVIGFEKTFLDGNASIGMRLPFIQVTGDGSVRRSDIGDLDIIGKYAFINDCETGNVLSAGLVATAPTGGNFAPDGAPDIHTWLLQPFVGGIYNLGDFYVQGFSSVLIPLENTDVLYWFNDLGFGYRLYQRDKCCDRLISSVTPIFEVHISTPLNHHGADQGGIDIVDLTFGATVGIGERSALNLGFVTPVTGPNPFDFELQVQFNWRF